MQRERHRLVLIGATLASARSGAASGQGERTVADHPGRIGLSPKQELELQRLPQRVASQVRSLWQKNWFEFARRELLQGRNPAPTGWKRTFCLLLINGGCSHQQLEHALQAQGLSPGSARSQASLAAAVFHAGRLIAHRQGRYTVSPN